MKKFKYISKFGVAAKINIGGKECFASNDLISHASLEDLRGLLPEEVERDKNPDLLYTAFPAFVANLVNANDDGIMTDEAIAIAPLFKDKQCNIEHMRSYIVGHVIGHGFSSFPSNEGVDVKSFAGSNKPFNISLAGVVYKVVDPYFADTLEDSTDPEHYLYRGISASWELGFDEYILAMGSKQLSEAELVTDDKQVEEMSKYLRAHGGSGFTDDGVPVYRIVKGSSVPLGIGYTSNPAAAVRGVAVASLLKQGDLSEEERKLIVNFISSDKALVNQIAAKTAGAKTVEIPGDENAGNAVETGTGDTPEPQKENSVVASAGEEKNKNKKSNKKSSQQTNSTVIKNTMKIKSLDDIQQDVLAEMQASDVRSFVREQLELADEKYKTLEAEKSGAEEKLKQDVANATAKSEQAEKTLGEIQKELKDIKESSAKAAQLAAFNERMSALSEEFELDDAKRSVIAKQIRTLSDEDYADWRKDFEVFQVSASADKGEGKTKEEVAADALASAKLTDKAIPNASTSEEDPLAKYRDSFAVGKGKGVLVRN